MKYIFPILFFALSLSAQAKPMKLICKDAQQNTLTASFDESLLDTKAPPPPTAEVVFQLNSQPTETWNLESFMLLPINGLLYLEFRNFEKVPTQVLALQMNPNKSNITATINADREDLELACAVVK